MLGRLSVLSFSQPVPVTGTTLSGRPLANKRVCVEPSNQVQTSANYFINNDANSASSSATPCYPITQTCGILQRSSGDRVAAARSDTESTSDG